MASEREWGIEAINTQYEQEEAARAAERDRVRIKWEEVWPYGHEDRREEAKIETDT